MSLSRTRTRIIRSALAIAGAGLCLAACAGDDTGSSEQYATDSWADPTNHGVLYFGVPNEARFTAEQRFHAWTFTLTDDADIDLRTQLSPSTNLDTIMYLYRYDEESGTWGSYIDKNDDYGEGMASQIAGTFGAGEYTIKVKTPKTYYTGNFAVLGTCAGGGCPALPGGGECDLNNPAGWPSSPGFTAECAQRLQDVLLAPVEAELNTSILYSERCEHGGYVGKAIDLYKRYWSGLTDWDDYYGEDPDMYVRATFHGDAGAAVYVDLGGDEDQLRFIFDGAGELQMFYHDEQSSYAEYTCGRDGEATIEEPDIECSNYLTRFGPHRADQVSHAEGTADPEDYGSIYDVHFVISAVHDFLEHYGISGEMVQYSTDYWGVDYDEYSTGAVVTLSAAGIEATYYMGEIYQEHMMLFMRTDASGSQMLCTDGWF
ncbi:MAG: hypothetical protein JRI23_09285 [Deltaproteobacteria bacterium]|jgi:hypothetical protein|nr:hypothetical protein [Deltaproteobacteria bacterium]MBW2531832.1 hypothetical protein [Deltaproteobacteria bacterium]